MSTSQCALQLLLHRVVTEHWPDFLERAEQAGGLPAFVTREFEVGFELPRCLDVTDLDLSKSMLDVAREKAHKRDISVHLVEGDMAEFDLGRGFGLILVAVSSF